jgi:serine/threonine protein kinase
MIIEDPNNGGLDVKLIDFNVSRRFRDEDTCTKYLMQTNTGAAAFTAPEVNNREKYNEKIDIWGVGTVLYYTLFGQRPFPQNTSSEL